MPWSMPLAIRTGCFNAAEAGAVRAIATQRRLSNVSGMGREINLNLFHRSADGKSGCLSSYTQKCSVTLAATGSVALLVDRFGSVVEDRWEPAYGLFPTAKAGGKIKPS